MIPSDKLIMSFSRLGTEFYKASGQNDLIQESNHSSRNILAKAIEDGYYHNPWFIPLFARFALTAWAEALKEEKVAKWIGKYLPFFKERKNPSIVGIIMAGNIPMVGLQDLLCVLASGNHALIKLASTDDQFIPAVLKVLFSIYPEFKDQISFVDGHLKNFDAIIATGSDNSSRYFDYYFGKYPHIIRKNRNGIAVLTGQESEGDLRKLADDIFMYFGLGCRNVSKLYLPEGFRAEDIFSYFSHYSFLSDFHKFRNNYDYQKSILLVNRVKYYDNGFLLLKEDTSVMSPISVIHTEAYHSIESLNHHLQSIKEQIQCIVSSSNKVDSAIPHGRSQFPELWDYADGIDTMNFLLKL